MWHIPCNWTVYSLLIAIMWSQVVAEVCDGGWFGPQCQYKCHCKSNRCSWDGKCSTGVCEKGWFGPDCQFLDLASGDHVEQEQEWMSDGNESTCNPNQGANPVVIHVAKKFIFKWLRLQVNDPNVLRNIFPIFSNAHDVKYMECAKIKKSIVNANTIDISCEIREAARTVILKGNGVMSLCSVYISGGRNVALRQKTIQSTTYSTGSGLEYLSGSKNAVDGNTDNTWAHGSCISTNDSDARPLWGVAFTHNQIISRYIVYNSDSNLDALRGFILTSYTDKMVPAFYYMDTSMNGSAVYIINEKPGQTTPVSLVTMHIDTEDYDPILKICEVEIYGDSACPPLMYGRECENKCNCAEQKNLCFASTGGCPFGCAIGFQGESCEKPCDFGKYGKDCGFLCSKNCNVRDNSTPCSHVDGKCFHGCGYWHALPDCHNKSKIVNLILIIILSAIVVISFLPMLFVAVTWRYPKNASFYFEVPMLPAATPLILSRADSEVYTNKGELQPNEIIPIINSSLENMRFTSDSSI